MPVAGEKPGSVSQACIPRDLEVGVFFFAVCLWKRWTLPSFRGPGGEAV